MILVWMRRDLRLDDHAALSKAEELQKQGGGLIQPVFFFDPQIIDRLDRPEDRRVEFLVQTLEQLHKNLTAFGSGLIARYQSPVEGMPKLVRDLQSHGLKVKHIVCARDYEGYAKTRDTEVENACRPLGVQFHTVKDHIVFEANEVRKDDGGGYTVFTPYSRKWKKVYEETSRERGYKAVSPDCFAKSNPLTKAGPSGSAIPTLEQMGFKATGFQFPSVEIDSGIVKSYAMLRDQPATRGTSRLGLHLRFGTVSIRYLVKEAMRIGSETWLNELIWRDFFSQILQNHSRIEREAFRPEFDRIQWRQDREAFERWTKGLTGVPIVDAGMRELVQTGFMHNRVRMIAGSYLVKNLLLDWRLGEAFFARYLLDFDFASNNGNWQWVAGSGCDASPYFRIFNPDLQAKKFDPKGTYIRTYVPDLLSPGYPSPMVTQAEARVRTLKAYSVVREK